VIVSHDRFILDRVVDFLFIFQEDKSIKMFPGNYSDYLLVKRYDEDRGGDVPIANPPSNREGREREKKPSYKQEMLLKQAEEEIEKLENEKKTINETINTKASELSHIDFHDLSERLNTIEQKLNEWYDIWEGVQK
jgi:ATP-binding cassette subfamily F protein uup